VVTPLKRSEWLSELCGAEVFLKLENLQLTGSFKFRGALNSLSWASEEGIHKVFAASAGNHGLGLAEGSRFVASDLTVCVPVNSSPFKRQRLRTYNIGLIEHGNECDVTEAFAQRLAKEKKGFYISPYNNAEVMAGQGTIALEILESLPDLTTLIASVGGGGLIGGIGTVARAVNPRIRVVGACAANSPVLKESVKAGRIVPVFVDQTVADGIAGNIEADSITFPVVREVVDEWVSVDEQDILSTIFEFLSNEGMVIEGSAAVAVAALSRKLIGVSPGEKVAIVICGGNIARETWQEIFFSHRQESFQA